MAGDLEAFRALYDRHFPAVLGYAAVRVGRVVAEDVVGETFAVAWGTRSSFRPEATSVRPWLYGIATVLLQRHQAAERRWQRGMRAVSTPGHATATEQPAGFDAIDPMLARALARLTRPERAVLLLVSIGELRVGEAADALGITPAAARVRLHRARARMVTALDGDATTKDTP